MRRVAYEGAVGGLGEPEAAVKPFFACSGIWKSFRKGGESRLVLPGVSVAIPRGGVLALIGASGCGKTTLLNILAGFDAPDAGTVTLEGRPCGGPGPDRAVVFQEPALFPWLTALENVELPLIYRGIDRKTRRKLAVESLKKVGLEKRMDHKPNEMSGGQQQRVAIARAIAARPPVILADEPTGNLDSASSETVMEYLQMINKDLKKTVVLVTHDAYVASFCNRVIFVKDGNIEVELRKNEKQDVFCDKIMKAQKDILKNK